MIILDRMLIIYEYPNGKNKFYTIYDYHSLVRKYICMGLCLTRNEDKGVNSTIFRKK